MFTHLRIRLGFQLPHLSPAFVSPVHKYAPSSISNYIWNTSKLLFISGHVGTNPEPKRIDQDPIFCSLCSNRINCGAQQDTTPTCSDKNCNARCHQICSSLSHSQTCHAKNCGHSITWKSLNMTLASLKWSSHLLQFMSSQDILLLLENLAQFAKILFTISMPT